MRSKLSFVILVVAIFGLAPASPAQQRDAEREAEIAAELAAVAPDKVPAFAEATAAMDAGENERAARLFKEVVDAVPAFDHAVRRMGSSLVQSGKVAEGRTALERAVQMRGSPENLGALALGLAYPGEAEGTKAEKTRALDLAGRAFRLNTRHDAYYAGLYAQIALDLERATEFREASKHLSERYPERMETHLFAALRAALDGDSAAAEREIRQAESMGLPSEKANQFLAEIEQPTLWTYVKWPVLVVLAWAGGILALFALGKWLSAATLGWLRDSDPNETDAPASAKLRQLYRWVINAAGIYYYLSLPVVVLLVVGLAGAVIYGFMMLGWLPVKLLFVLAIGAAVTVFYMVRSVFVRAHEEDPGRSLTEAEAPGLWGLAREVAERVGTRPVDDIRMTVGTDLAVYEKGSVRERMSDTGRRVLLVGAGVLNDFKSNDFRAVLAHEYGHFQNRDTAGGDVALRVRMSMMKLAESMIASGQATVWNVAFHFLRLYDFVFRRISHGATRLQEVLADRTAVRLYGAPAFECGLSHVIRRSVEFDYLAEREVRDAIENKRSLNNLYAPARLEGTDDEEVIAKLIKEVMERPTTADDTHPAPGERIALAHRIQCEAPPTSDGEVWDLFADRDALTAEMCKCVERSVREAYGA
jgi:uncharacterized membrane protein